MPEKAGKFRIIDRIGGGALGTVFKGFDTEAGRYVAVKFLHAHLSRTGENRRLYLKSVIPAVRLHHPHIVQIHDLAEQDHDVFAVMEHLDGVDLQYFLSAAIRLSPAQTVNLLTQLGEGLAHAHAEGILHLGLKPSDILVLKSGNVKVVDFGMAAVASALLPDPLQWPVARTAYLSPEQASGERPGPASDVYAAGLIALEMVTGLTAFRRATAAQTLEAVRAGDSAPFLAKCPEPLRSVLARATARRPAERFETAEALLQACRDLARSFLQDEGRLDGAGGEAEAVPVLDEPYEARVVRKYLREGKADAADSLLAKLEAENPAHGVIPALKAEVERLKRRRRCDDLNKIGSEMVERGDYDLALETFNEVLKLDPDRVDAISGIQKARRLQKEQRFREKIEPLLAQAAAHGMAGRYIEANEVYRTILGLDPELPEVRQRIEENEGRLARDSRARVLAGLVQRAVRLGDIPAAFTALRELEETAPGEPLARESFASAWKMFAESFEETACIPFKGGDTREFDRWFARVGEAPDIGVVLSAPAHREERNRLLTDARRLVTELTQSRRLTSAKAALDGLNSLFPGLHALRETADEVDQQLRAEEDLRRRQRANEQRLEDGLSSIREALSAEDADGAHVLWVELNRLFPSDKTLSSLRPAIDAAVARAEENRWVDLQVERLKAMLDAEEMDKARAHLENVENSHPKRPELAAMRKLLAEKERLVAQKLEIRRIQEEIVRHRASGKVDAALDLVKKAIQRFPDEGSFYPALQQIQNEKALRDTGEQIGGALRELADLVDRKHFLRAGRVAFELIERFPENPSALEGQQLFRERRREYIENAVRSALSFSANRVFDEAARILERALEECPDALDLKNAFEEVRGEEQIHKRITESRAFLEQRKYDLAVASLEEFAARYPEKAALLRCLEEARRLRNAYVAESVRSANAFLKSGDTAKALSILKTAAERVPNSEEIGLKIEDIEFQQSEWVKQRKAEETENRAMLRDVDRSLAEARRLVSRGNPLGALKLLGQARQRLPKSSEPLEALVRDIQEQMDRQVHPPEPSGVGAPKGRRPAASPGRRRWVPAVMVLVLAVIAVWAFFQYIRVGTLRVDLGKGGVVTAVQDAGSGKTVLTPGTRMPLSLTLAPGDYVLVCTMPEMPGVLLREPVRVEFGRTRTVTVVPLTVDLRPAGTVEEILRVGSGDRLPFHNAPMPLRVRLPAGSYQLVFRITDIPGVRFSESVDLRPGEPLVFSPALLTLDLRPGGRVTSLVRKDTGTPVPLQDDDMPFRVSLSPGQYALEWEFTGLEDRRFREELVLKAGEKKLLVKDSPEAAKGGGPLASILLDKPEEAALLVIDPRPWGKVVEVVRQDTGERLVSGAGVTPYALRLPPGLYRVVFTLSDHPGREFSEIVNLPPKGRHVVRKMSPLLEARMESLVEGLLK
ncbi:MAG: protein kinase [Acidobacteria bacterium]|nr:protein kinase [Acidobacteriota bacterium]